VSHELKDLCVLLLRQSHHFSFTDDISGTNTFLQYSQVQFLSCTSQHNSATVTYLETGTLNGFFPSIREASVTFEGFTPMAMKNAVFWDIKNQSVLHRRHITSLLQSLAG
jgi:hypothetical protein